MSLFEKVFQESDIILTEGAVVERLKSEFHVALDRYINHAGLIYSNPHVWELLYRQYIDIGHKYNLPMMVMTPTRKVNFDSAENSAFLGKEIIKDACLFLKGIRDQYENSSQSILIGGLLGCKGDAYISVDALGVDESYEFHLVQALQFKREAVDFLFAGIMPEINEAIGMARAMAETEIPYIISFMIRKDGCLIDGTPISEAIELIDQSVNVPPLCYMSNCIHPANLRLALTNDKNRNKSQLSRFKGIQANASALSPEELDNCGVLQCDDFDVMIEEMKTLYQQFNLKIFGGCCGTNDKFMDDLARAMLHAEYGLKA
jgi:S-methylmethionine-dependent homocysteine/selenocysteine methylase